MVRIKKITAREILDSRGYPTVAADVLLDDGNTGTAAVPSGASTGSHEALELRDGGTRYNGKGVLKAVANVERISQQLAGMNPFDIRLVDESMLALDGTENKTNLGANAMLAVSMAVLRAGCHSAKLPLYQHLRNVYNLDNSRYILPAPMLNIINGGKHADSGLDVQEFMIVPTAPKTFAEALREASEISGCPACLAAAKIVFSTSSCFVILGAKPPSSPTAITIPSFLSKSFKK